MNKTKTQEHEALKPALPDTEHTRGEAEPQHTANDTPEAAEAPHEADLDSSQQQPHTTHEAQQQSTEHRSELSTDQHGTEEGPIEAVGSTPGEPSLPDGYHTWTKRQRAHWRHKHK